MRTVPGKRFTRFAEIDCKGKSAVYETLARGAAGDPFILSLVKGFREPEPNLLFAVIRFLLLTYFPDHPLAAFLTDVSPGLEARVDIYSCFHSFCREHEELIRRTAYSRKVQTQEVRRCSQLLPAFMSIVMESKARALSLIEVGAAAGINLLWNEYHYEYSDGYRWGNSSSPVRLKCELRGDVTPPRVSHMPPIVFNVGIDLEPLNLFDPDDVRWLESLIWPGHHLRLRLLREAVEFAKERLPEVIRGEASAALPGLCERAPGDSLLCIYHTFAYTQMPKPTQHRLDEAIEKIAGKRDVFRLSIDWTGYDSPQMILRTYRGGAVKTKTLASCNGHGDWLRWL